MKKLLVSLLSAAMAISSISGSIVTAKADDEIDTSKLRVSDEFVEKYPNGLIEFVNVGSEVNEDAGETTIYVVRRGGTKGTVSVNLKAIEVTAKYGEDFAVMDEGLFGPKEVKKSSNTPSLLEGAINDAKDTAITADGYEEEKEETKTEETQDVSKNSEEQKEEETTSNDETNKEEKEVENIQVEKKYESSLHALKDKTL